MKKEKDKRIIRNNPELFTLSPSTAIVQLSEFSGKKTEKEIRSRVKASLVRRKKKM